MYYSGPQLEDPYIFMRSMQILGFLRGGAPFFSQEPSGYACPVVLDLARRSAGHDSAAVLPPAGPHVDDVVRAADHVQIVFDDDEFILSL